MSLDAKAIGARIHSLRLQRGETQVEFGKAVGSRPPTVSNWEKGRTLAKLPKLKKIASHFNVEFQFLIGDAFRIEQARELTLHASREMLKAEGKPVPARLNAASGAIARLQSAERADTATNEIRQLMETARDRFRRKLARLRLGEG